MYQRSIALLWAGGGAFAGLAVTAAALDSMGNTQDVWIGAASTCLVCSCILIATRNVSEKLLKNRSDVLGRVAHLRSKVDRLEGKVSEVRDIAEVNPLMNEARRGEQPPEPDRPLATVHPFRLRDGRREAILGRATDNPVDPEDILAFLEQAETQTLPGRFTAS